MDAQFRCSGGAARAGGSGSSPGTGACGCGAGLGSDLCRGGARKESCSNAGSPGEVGTPRGCHSPAPPPHGAGSSVGIAGMHPATLQPA